MSDKKYLLSDRKWARISATMSLLHDDLQKIQHIVHDLAMFLMEEEKENGKDANQQEKTT